MNSIGVHQVWKPAFQIAYSVPFVVHKPYNACNIVKFASAFHSNSIDVWLLLCSLVYIVSRLIMSQVQHHINKGVWNHSFLKFVTIIYNMLKQIIIPNNVEFIAHPSFYFVL